MMKIAGEYGIIPPWVADWPNCCDIGGDTCNDLRWPSMLLEAQNRRKMTHFIAACGRAFRERYKVRGMDKGSILDTLASENIKFKKTQRDSMISGFPCHSSFIGNGIQAIMNS